MTEYVAAEVPDEAALAVDHAEEDQESMRRRALRWGVAATMVGMAAVSHTARVRGYAVESPPWLRDGFLNHMGHPAFGAAGASAARLVDRKGGWGSAMVGAAIGDAGIEVAQSLWFMLKHGTFYDFLRAKDLVDTAGDGVAAFVGGGINKVLRKKPRTKDLSPVT